MATAITPQIVFQHLRKTGGTSIISLINNFISSEPSRPLFSGRITWAEIEREASRLQFLHSHSSSLLSLRKVGSVGFTFLRDPLSRLLSERRQWMQAKQENLDEAPEDVVLATLALRDLPLARILDRIFAFPVTVPSYWNHQTLTLGIWPLIQANSVIQEKYDFHYAKLYTFFSESSSFCAWIERHRYAILKNARHALRSLDYIGIYEDFENSTREVLARLGLPEPETIPHLNAREPYPDENEEGIRARTHPFLDLDEELYDEARELHARHGRAVRGAAIDYLGRSVRANENKSFAAHEPPGGHGWYDAAKRGDGKWSRWTGPGEHSYFTLQLDRATYRIELTVFGAVSEKAVRTVSLSADSAPIETATTALPDGRWLIGAEMVCAEAGRHEIRVTVPEAANDHGIEVEAFRFIGNGPAIGGLAVRPSGGAQASE